jgi:hypothetical protein
MMDQKFKVIADGTIRGTRIFAPNGDDISGTVRAIKIEHEVGQLPLLTMEVYGAEIDVTALGDETRTYTATGK